jgi:hypothetical protein
VFTYYEEPGNASRALLVRAKFLREFLATHKLELVALHWFQRMELSERHDGKHPQLQSAIEARLGSDLAIHEGKPRREEHDLIDRSGTTPPTVRYKQPGHPVGKPLHRSPSSCTTSLST